jgi:hypothetical protein
MAPDDIVGTESWPDQILAAISSSKAMLILVSSASNKSPHVSREVNLALGEGRPSCRSASRTSPRAAR